MYLMYIKHPVLLNMRNENMLEECVLFCFVLSRECVGNRRTWQKAWSLPQKESRIHLQNE